jgi:hypothetical protein
MDSLATAGRERDDQTDRPSRIRGIGGLSDPGGDAEAKQGDRVRDATRADAAHHISSPRSDSITTVDLSECNAPRDTLRTIDLSNEARPSWNKLLVGRE